MRGFRSMTIALALLGGCASGFSPVERSGVVIAITGFDEALKDRFSKEAPDGDERVRLSLAFQEDAVRCEGGYNDIKAGLPGVAVFQESAALDVMLPGDGVSRHVRLFNVSDGAFQPAIRAGDYAFRDGAVDWHDPIHFSSLEWHLTRATSEEQSLSFVYDGRPVFVGLYAISMNARDELVLTEIPAPPEVMTAAAGRLGISGAMPQRPQLRTRKMVRCGALGGIRRTNTD